MLLKEKTFKIKDIINYLNQHVIGQDEAKKDIAVAIKRRSLMEKVNDPEWKDELAPSNMLLIGDTGVGKTEIMRRLAKFLNVPFVKVDITEFSQVGYVGRNVEEIIKVDLLTAAQDYILKYHKKDVIDDQFIEELAKHVKMYLDSQQQTQSQQLSAFNLTGNMLQQMINTIEDLIEKIKNEDPEIMNTYVEILIQVPIKIPHMNIVQHQPIMLAGTVKEVIDQYVEIAIKYLLTDKVKELTKDTMEHAIVFIDEIDKIAGHDNRNVSTVGVQRSLLTLLEDKDVILDNGLKINTKRILFVAAGAFKIAKVTDLLPELQGRLSYVIYLKPFTKEELRRILIEPKYSIIKKLQKIYEADGYKLVFTDDAIDFIAETAYELNEKENLGARRLIQLTEQLTAEIDYDLELGNIQPDDNNTIAITKEYLQKKYDKIKQRRNQTHHEKHIGF